MPNDFQVSFNTCLRLLPLLVAMLFAPSVSAQSLHELNEFTHMYMAGEMDAPSYKAQVDAMLATQTEPSRKAELLYALLKRLCNNLSGNEDLVIFYSKTALDLPLSPAEKVQVLVHQADAFQFKSKAEPEHERELKLCALRSCLQALDLCVTEQKNEAIQPLPAVDIFNISLLKSSPVYQRMENEHQRQIADRKFIEEQNDLIDLRRGIDGNTKHLFEALHLTETDANILIGESVKSPQAKQFILEHLAF